MYYIYSIHNGLFHKTYIGFTSNYNRRITQHKSELKSGKHHCEEMQFEYNCASHSKNNYMTYEILAEHKDKEIAQGLEYLFLYKHIAYNKKLYNKVQIRFPLGLVERKDDYANSFIDNRTILHAFMNKEIGDTTFERICKILGKDDLVKLLSE